MLNHLNCDAKPAGAAVLMPSAVAGGIGLRKRSGLSTRSGLSGFSGTVLLAAGNTAAQQETTVFIRPIADAYVPGTPPRGAPD